MCRLTSALVLVLVVALAGGCGDDEGGNGPKLKANETDMAFASDMLAHHELGIDAADLATRRGQDRVIRISARDLIQLQSPETQVLRAVRRTLAEGGVEKGDLGVPDTTLDLAELRRAPDFDAAFAAAMIDHHRVAIEMSEAERRGGIHEELRRMSGDIIDLARFQIRQLERWQRRSGS